MPRKRNLEDPTVYRVYRFPSELFAETSRNAEDAGSRISHYIVSGVKILNWLDEADILPAFVKVETESGRLPLPLPFQDETSPANLPVNLTMRQSELELVQTLGESSEYGSSRIVREGAKLRNGLVELVGDSAMVGLYNTEDNSAKVIFF